MRRARAFLNSDSDWALKRDVAVHASNDLHDQATNTYNLNMTTYDTGTPNSRPPRALKNQNLATLGVDDVLGAGDSRLVLDVLPPDLAETAFARMREEVRWDTMFHRGGEVPRKVAVEGVIDEDGSFPIYRHPADESPALLPFSATVQRIREHVQGILAHPVNHVLIQHYRSGTDYISEHSDKTIDVVRGTKIVNVSLGAQRTMTLRMKKDSLINVNVQVGDKPPPRPAQRIPLPHNSMFVMGLETNRRWLHGIGQDKRMLALKDAAELGNGGERISLTFRCIGTFLSADQTQIWGQGACAKTKEQAGATLTGEDGENGKKEAEALIWAFGRENAESEFDWEGVYGAGSDVLHFSVKAKKTNRLKAAAGDTHQAPHYCTSTIINGPVAAPPPFLQGFRDCV
ncbi:hypothetical protein FIBSPDRAFT_938095 [Athelia psychrophila]|uniref:Fe2OG dioxygenase domain-containing protein n=1 Tax=Athelia psychrophila TaxID=1759441 RepID=A0A165Z7M7_9AGAM|nr:hypothetical protein FIBSPDRAFT_938095 [Fibularhizoctonia sp. CBS 109695]